MNNLFEQESDDSNIDLKSLFKTILREKNIVFIITFIATLISIIHSLVAKPIFIGGFDILVKENEINPSDAFGNPKRILRIIGTKNATQKLILSSPSLLMPVFTEVKKYHEEIGDPKENMTFKSWQDAHLNISFKKESNVLNVSYKHPDKNHILNTLNLISNIYQDYSKSLILSKRERTLKSLKEQKSILETNFLNSQKKLNQYSIENGLGNFDGFISLISNSNDSSSSEKTKGTEQNIPSPWQRYSSQFRLLEKYESQYIDLSSKLRDSSNTKKLLKEKIENLRLALKRPNEILVKHRNLTRQAMRDEKLLKSVSLQFELAKLEKMENPFPWQLISNPTLDEGRIYPLRRQQVTATFIISTLIGSLLAIIKEKRKRIFYDLKDIKENISVKFLDTIYLSDLDLCANVVKSYFLKNNISKNNQFGIISLKPSNLKLLKINLINKIIFL